jgi:hypothetical protein
MSASQATLGYLSQFQVGAGSPLVYSTLAEVRTIKNPEYTVRQVDVTHLLSPNATEESIPGLLVPGEVEITGNFTGHASQAYLRALGRTRQVFPFKIISPMGLSGTALTITGSGYIVKWETGPFQADKQIDFAFTLKMTDVSSMAGGPGIFSQSSFGKCLANLAGHTPPAGWNGNEFNDFAWGPCIQDLNIDDPVIYNVDPTAIANTFPGTEWITDSLDLHDVGDQVLFRFPFTAERAFSFVISVMAYFTLIEVWVNGVQIWSQPPFAIAGLRQDVPLVVGVTEDLVVAGDNILAMRVETSTYADLCPAPISLDFATAGF